MHAQTHAPGVPNATTAAQEEKNNSREGKWKHVLKKKGFNFHESLVRRVICFSLSISLFLPLRLALYHPACVCVISDFPFLFFSPPGSSTADMRVGFVCVSANIPVSFLRSLSYSHLLLPLWGCQSRVSPHYREYVLSSVTALYVSSFVLFLVCSLHPFAFLTQSLLVSKSVFVSSHICISYVFVCWYLIGAQYRLMRKLRYWNQF